MATECARWRAGLVELLRQLEACGGLVEGSDVELLGVRFATLSDNLVDKGALDPSIDGGAIMREMLRPLLVSGGAPVLDSGLRRRRPERRTRAAARRT